MIYDILYIYLLCEIFEVEADDDIVEEFSVVQTEIIFISYFNASYGGWEWVCKHPTNQQCENYNLSHGSNTKWALEIELVYLLYTQKKLSVFLTAYMSFQ